jgi:hypothetical protein
MMLIRSNVIAGCVALMIFLAACNKNPTSTVNPLKEDTAAVFICWIKIFQATPSFCEAELLSDPVADDRLCMMEMDWGNHHSYWYHFSSPYSVKFYWTPDTSYHGFGDTVVNIKMTSNMGFVSGSIKIPGGNAINYPGVDDTISLDDSIPVIWSSSRNAEWYRARIEAWGYDTIAHGTVSVFQSEHVCKDTIWWLPARYFSTINIPVHSCVLSLGTYTGPEPVPGALGNMQGSIKGFLIGSNMLNPILFYVKR